MARYLIVVFGSYTLAMVLLAPLVIVSSLAMHASLKRKTVVDLIGWGAASLVAARVLIGVIG